MNWIKFFLGFTVLPFISVVFSLFLFESFLNYDNYYVQPKLKTISFFNNDYSFLDRPGIDIFDNSNIQEKKIAIIGDSFIQGLHCAFKNSDLPAHIQNHIGDTKLVINLGVEGKNPADYIDWLSRADFSSEDEVVIALYDNDIHLTEGNCAQINRQALSLDIYIPKLCRLNNTQFVAKDNNNILKRINNKTKEIKVVQIAKEGLINIPIFSSFFYRNEFISGWNDYEAEETKWIISAIGAMKKIIEEKQALAHFIYYPNTNFISQSDPRHEIWKNFIQKMRDESGIEIKDPYPYLIQNASSQSMVWSLTDKHPSCEAHKIVSEYVISEVILNNK